MRLIFCIIFCFSSYSPIFASDDAECEGNWLGYIKSGLARVVSVVGTGVNKGTDVVRKRLIEAPQITNQVISAFGDVATQTSEVAKQIANLAKEAGIVSFNFALATPGTVTKGVYRIIMFSPDNQGIKSGIVVPLVGHLRNIRTYNESQNKQSLAKELNRLVFFIPEALFKLYRCGVNTAQSSGLGLAKAAFGKLTGLPVRGNTAEQGLLKLVSAFVGDVFTAITTPNLSLSERIALMADSETRYASVLAEMITEMGWTDFEAEIAAWRSAETASPHSDETTAADSTSI